MRITISYPKAGQQLASPKLPLLINGKIARTVTQGKILSLPLENPAATLSVRGDKKSTITVHEGDRIEIKENSQYFILYYLSLAILPIVLLFQLHTIIKITLLTLSLIITLVGQQIFPKYILRIKESSDQ